MHVYEPGHVQNSDNMFLAPSFMPKTLADLKPRVTAQKVSEVEKQEQQLKEQVQPSIMFILCYVRCAPTSALQTNLLDFLVNCNHAHSKHAQRFTIMILLAKR